MNAGIEAILYENLKSLKLSTIIKNLESSLRQAKENSISYEEFLLNLTENEVRVRNENGYKRRLREAKFPLLKTLESFDFESSPGLDIRLIKDLSAGEYIKERRNIIFMGKSGTGKSHLATSLGVEACKQKLRTRFVTGCGLANELIESRSEHQLSRIIKRYSDYGLLIIDELGYVPFSKEGAELIFQVLANRHEQKSVIITTNLGFGDWTQVFGEANLTSALLDRVTHKAHIVNCNWESFRLKETIKKK